MLYLAILSLEEGKPEEAEALARLAADQFRTDQSATDQAGAYLVISRSLLARGKTVDA